MSPSDMRGGGIAAGVFTGGTVSFSGLYWAGAPWEVLMFVAVFTGFGAVVGMVMPQRSQDRLAWWHGLWQMRAKRRQDQQRARREQAEAKQGRGTNLPSRHPHRSTVFVVDPDQVRTVLHGHQLRRPIPRQRPNATEGSTAAGARTGTPSTQLDPSPAGDAPARPGGTGTDQLDSA